MITGIRKKEKVKMAKPMGVLRTNSIRLMFGLFAGTGFLVLLIGGIAFGSLSLLSGSAPTAETVVVAEDAGKSHLDFTWAINPVNEINEILIEDVDVGSGGIEIFGTSTGGNSDTMFIEELVFEDVKASEIIFGAALSTGSATFDTLTIDQLTCEGDDEQFTNTPAASQVNLLPYATGTGDSHILKRSIVPHIVVSDGTSTADGAGKIRKLTLRRVTSRGAITVTGVAVNTGDFTQISAGDGDQNQNSPDCVFGWSNGALLVNESTISGVVYAEKDYR